ncbi:MAG: glycosyltransferase family 9 protein [Chitinophagaceae bacterium]
MNKFLVIQTAFIGDVVLATSLLEKLNASYPNAQIDILVRKGNESLFANHPFIHETLVWNKKKQKYQHLFQLLFQIRKSKYDVVINVQRYAATGFLTAFSGAKNKIGFHNNPFAFLFTTTIQHQFSYTSDKVIHEIERNQQLITSITNNAVAKPRLYPSESDYATVEKWQNEPYICIAPASVWFTKQFPTEKWISFIQTIPIQYTIYLLGAPTDKPLCDTIVNQCASKKIENLAGKLTFLQSAALQKKAVMNYVNDSAPMHFASSVNAPTTAIYCSTIPSFGYGPLSEQQFIVESTIPLACRPCGLHGHASCPEKHFHCAMHITNEQLLASLPITFQ